MSTSRVEKYNHGLLHNAIGSAYSSVAFHQNIWAARKKSLLNRHLSGSDLLSAEYLQNHQGTLMTEASCSMLKKYCIVEIFVPELESFGPTSRDLDFETPQTSAREPVGSASNLVYKKKAAIIDAIAKESYPGLAAPS